MAYLRTLLLIVLAIFASNPVTAAPTRVPALSAPTAGYVPVTQQLKGCYRTCRQSTNPNCFSLCKSGGTLQQNAKTYRAITCTKQCGAHDVACTNACIRKLRRQDF